jgi:hypothetical protein
VLSACGDLTRIAVTCACILTSQRSTMGRPFGFIADANALLPRHGLHTGAKLIPVQKLIWLKFVWRIRLDSNQGFPRVQGCPTTRRRVPNKRKNIFLCEAHDILSFGTTFEPRLSSARNLSMSELLRFLSMMAASKPTSSLSVKFYLLVMHLT